MSIFSGFFHALRSLISDGEGKAESDVLAGVAKVEEEVKDMIAAAVKPLSDRLDALEARAAASGPSGSPAVLTSSGTGPTETSLPTA